MGFFGRPLGRGSLLTVLAFSSVLGCRSRSFNGTEVNQTTSPVSVTEENSPNTFRNLFYTYLKQANFPDERIQQAVFLPPPELAQEGPYPANGEEALGSLRARFSKARPSDLFQNGVRTPFQPIPNPEAAFARTGAVTIILVPGIFGEFIENRPFEEVLNSGSLHARFTPALKARQTSIYSLQALNKVQVPLSEAVTIGSIDGANGQPLVNLILLRPGFASLETLGTLQSNTETYLKRLEEIFAVIPADATKNLYFMGYSRGTPVALELLSTAFRNPQRNPWASRVRGFVGLAGVYYGSELADDGLDEAQKSVNAKAIGTLNWLAKELQTTDGPGALPGFFNLTNGAVVTACNTAKWAQAACEFAALQQRAKSELPPAAGIENQFLHTDQIDLMSTASLLWRIAFESLNLKNPATDYNGNILKFKKLMGEVMEGISTLTVKSRLQWWREHTLPPQLKMYSITGSMPDAPENGQVSPMLNFDPFGPATADFALSLRGSFHSMAMVTGNQLNDSQVTLYSSRYWPRLTQSLNPNQAPLKHYYMGTLGTHHWGLAFPIAFKVTSGDVNHFPRAVLLKTIGTFLAMSQE